MDNIWYTKDFDCPFSIKIKVGTEWKLGHVDNDIFLCLQDDKEIAQTREKKKSWARNEKHVHPQLITKGWIDGLESLCNQIQLCVQRHVVIFKIYYVGIRLYEYTWF